MSGLTEQMVGRLLPVALLLLIATAPTVAADKVRVEPLPQGSVSKEDGLRHWQRIFQVFSHPRCANCHTGPSGIPMWSGPSYGEARPHGMNIVSGVSRIGADALLCSACHGRRNNTVPHGPPGVDMPWRLAPAQAHWFGRSSTQICEQVRDPARNGNRSFVQIAEHLDHDLILHWAWAPGPGREPAPFSLQENINDILAWGAAGMPCPQ